MWIVVGLGNPGSEYAGTRHNVGYHVLDRLATDWGMVPKPADFDRMARHRFDGLTHEMPDVGFGRVMLIKPITFMNLSGRAVGAAAAFFKVPPDHVLVLTDDIALPAAKLRIRPGGSDGGHKGLKDIVRALGTQEFPRVRIGVDPPPGNRSWADWVLARPTAAQWESITEGIHRAVDAVKVCLQEGLAPAMNRFNPSPKAPEAPAKPAKPA